MKNFCIGLAFALLFGVSAYAQNFSCPSGTEDMLDYFVMSYPDRTTNYMGPGNANPIYTTIVPDLGASYAASGYFVWTKSSAGYPWDVKTFDTKYVYDRTTELNWGDPTSFKRFTSDLPMSQRCVKIGAPSTTIRLNPSQTSYSFYDSCKAYSTKNLNYAQNTVTAPAMVQTQGNLGAVETRKFEYEYGCNSSYSYCSDMEVFSLGHEIGLYEWQHYQNSGGKWNLVQTSNINQYDLGDAKPYLPCANSY